MTHDEYGKNVQHIMSCVVVAKGDPSLMAKTESKRCALQVAVFGKKLHNFGILLENNYALCHLLSLSLLQNKQDVKFCKNSGLGSDQNIPHVNL